MAVNVVLEGNILKINTTVAGSIKYWNASWVSIDFSGTTVVLTNNVLTDLSGVDNPYVIEMADFQYDSVAKTTEAAIVTALSTIIG